MLIYTIGHSTRPFDEFVAVLRAHAIEAVADVRTVPKSRHNPQFHIDALTRTLPEAGLGYVHLRALGGLRHARPDSPNAGWRNASFRGYADYMQTPEFAAGLAELLALAAEKRTVIMCAEAVPWRCHRSLVGDALLVRGHEVIDIYDKRTAKPERLTSFAVVDGLEVTYPAP
ncbi:DNA repair protein [Intrasporangium chromatireducens Q5-1]|uniref:DNA repair protein n=1 Tax=Intrasporangium chromatireducens Q5-1 TaxID=584657 RepID=W9GP58_9MICO|nr:DUF488 domain-containing protein [Intrasporangium chromatireducens]EWT05674.1 DNA repair protein [Intrasporangium chromatireducens Q5-1]